MTFPILFKALPEQSIEYFIIHIKINMIPPQKGSWLPLFSTGTQELSLVLIVQGDPNDCKCCSACPDSPASQRLSWPEFSFSSSFISRGPPDSRQRSSFLPHLRSLLMVLPQFIPSLCSKFRVLSFHPHTSSEVLRAASSFH